MKPLLDNFGKVIAFTHEISPNRLQIFGSHGQLLGWFDPTINKTFDRTGRYIGTGDLRTMLIPR